MEPVLKWAGGKRQLLKELKKYITKDLIGNHRYFEPFVGGGAVAFSLECSKLTINDYNKELINVYLTIKNEPQKLIQELKKHQKHHSKDYYYKIRSLDRNGKKYQKLSNVAMAARTIYLNKTCYNGLYRVNSEGYYNVPIGKTLQNTIPDIVMEEKINKLSRYFNNNDVVIKCGDFSESVKDAKKGDVIYFDPPYDYGTDGFKAYTKIGFSHEDLIRLKNLCDELIKKGCKIIVSNNDTQFVRECFNLKNYTINSIDAKRYINCKASKRKNAKEVIIFGEKLD